ncbi:glycosyltransferase family 25 protein [Sphingobium bisphenolivorans]|uniref:glycosyltransferase family 25 protein n=1 Tax=Sphingobium bisphenolivorans TaxID=1335760 RepID=UPI0003A51ACE|nr:glycosyltransferase family 25 protein [Sphingobium bisphenolivorans]
MSDSQKVRILVISMAEAIARRAAFRQRAEGATLAWEFVDAHTSLHPQLYYLPEKATRVNGRPLQAGEIGCYSSHFALWLQLLDDSVDHYLIFEDDVIIDWNFVQAFAGQIENDVRFDYIRFYYKRPVPAVRRAFPFVTADCSLMELYGRAYGTQGYFISKDAARRLVEACRHVERPIDDQMDRSWVHGVPNLALFPCPIMEENVPSIIGRKRFERIGPRPEHVTRNLNRDRKAARRAYWRAAAIEWLSIKRNYLIGRMGLEDGRVRHDQ